MTKFTETVMEIPHLQLHDRPKISGSSHAWYVMAIQTETWI